MILEVFSSPDVTLPFWSLSGLRWSYQSNNRDFLCLPYEMFFAGFVLLGWFPVGVEYVFINSL